MSFLVDTNVFLEVLLAQPGKERCKQFLQKNAGNCGISDFSLHSIGVIAFRGRRADRYLAFLNDIFPQLDLLHLARHSYSAVEKAHQRFGLDFDDAYQFALAESQGLELATQDQDFRRVGNAIPVTFV